MFVYVKCVSVHVKRVREREDRIGSERTFPLLPPLQPVVGVLYLCPPPTKTPTLSRSLPEPKPGFSLSQNTAHSASRAQCERSTSRILKVYTVR